MITIQNKKKKKYNYLEPIHLDYIEDKLLLYSENVFNDDECNHLIEVGEKNKYELASLYIDKKKKIHYATDIRNSFRCLIDDNNFANVLEQRIKHLIPETYNGLTFDSINPRFRFLKYEKSGHFIRHTDEHFVLDKTKSLITILIYLNNEYEGGYTRFFSNKDDKTGYTMIPQSGMICIMDQTIEHDVPPITSGTKYAIRSELMYM